MKKIATLQRIISAPRFKTYLKYAHNDQQQAYQLYFYNLEISSILYYNTHWLEIVLRNAINDRLCKAYGDDWYHHIGLIDKDKQLIDDALEKSMQSKKASNGDIISSLNFGFWTLLFKPRYDELWRHHLRHIFKSASPLRSKNINQKLHAIRKTRNRIAHYEQIFEIKVSRNHQITPNDINQYIIDIVDMLEADSSSFLKAMP